MSGVGKFDINLLNIQKSIRLIHTSNKQPEFLYIIHLIPNTLGKLLIYLIFSMSKTVNS